MGIDVSDLDNRLKDFSQVVAIKSNDGSIFPHCPYSGHPYNNDLSRSVALLGYDSRGFLVMDRDFTNQRFIRGQAIYSCVM